MNGPGKYVIIKPRAGGVAFWRSIAYYLREGTHRVIRLWLHSKAALYLFPADSVNDTMGSYMWNIIVADIHKIDWARDEQEEIIVEKKKAKYTDEWGYQGETWILKIKTKEKQYTVYPNTKIKDLLQKINN